MIILLNVWVYTYIAGRWECACIALYLSKYKNVVR